ncbi:unnamed protein product [Rotaria sordida]|uniref:Uncharacterized protein n=1 Tax=Rotaria sordida TaxID=392033 RepID=A0A819KGH8_9BILA|nr:unnamed protein product [Rotaria sordida]CAF3948706.1 unnamed protein product [Rotaria sordida]
MRDLSFSKSKLWGMALAPIWWHCDFSRYSRRYYILLNANQWPQIGLTMDDDDIVKVYKILKNKMDMNPLPKQSLPNSSFVYSRIPQNKFRFSNNNPLRYNQQVTSNTNNKTNAINSLQSSTNTDPLQESPMSIVSNRCNEFGHEPSAYPNF